MKKHSKLELKTIEDVGFTPTESCEFIKRNKDGTSEHIYLQTHTTNETESGTLIWLKRSIDSNGLAGDIIEKHFFKSVPELTDYLLNLSFSF